MTRRLWLVAILLGCQACGLRGLIYSEWTEPYTKDFRQTPVGSLRVTVKDTRIEEPVSGYNLSAEWQIDVIIDAAREQGMTNIHYIDIEYFSVLGGIYSNKTFIVYGD